jgi:hypothetical protein
MNLIDIYITEVGKHLPKKSRLDIQQEIRSTLLDLLEDRSQQSGKPVDEELTFEVLKEYGSPEKVAASYLPERYLIGPRLFPAFLKTIQIVAPIIGILALIGLSISLSQAELSPKNWFETILQAVAGFFNSIVIALGYIVLILAILERVSPDLKEKPTPWDPHSLAKISPPDRVTIGEPIAAIILNFAAIVIFNFYPRVVGASYVAGEGWSFTQILSEAFFHYLPVLNLLWVLKIVLNIILFRQGQWQTGTRWFSLGLQAMEVGIAVAMLKGPSLITLTAQELFAKWSIPLDSSRILVELSNQMVNLVLIIIIVVGIVEIVKTILRLLKNSKPASLVIVK